MTKKKKVAIVYDSEEGLAVDKQKTPLAKSIVLAATLLEENEQLTERVAALEERLRGNLEVLDRAIVDLEKNEHLTARVALLESRCQRLVAQRDKVESDQLAYWKARRRRFFGHKHLYIEIAPLPWSWQWKPKMWRGTGEGNVSWLFLRAEVIDE